MDLKKLTIREFDRAAEQFDDDSVSVYNICRNDYPDLLSEINSEPWASVLDAGCGTGAVIYLLHEKYPGKSYTGIDLSEKMIASAKRKISAVQLLSWVTARSSRLRTIRLMW